MKTFFFIPGFGQKATDKKFSWLINFLKKNNFNVIKVPVEWKYKTMTDYVCDFEEFYNKNKTETNYILGFSYGAVITFLSASKLKPKKIYLCSLSPDFKEDLSGMKLWIKKLIGKRRIIEMKKNSGKIIAKNLLVPSVVFYGGTEGKIYPKLKIRCEETVKLAKNSKLIVIKKAPHDINYPEYMDAVKNEINKLS
jgi:dienelactone hydrolase